MIVTLPPAATHLAAISLTGWTRRPADAGPVLRDAVVLKGLFTLATTSGTRVAEPAAGPAGIVFADEGSIVFADDDPSKPNGYDLTHEADLALEKAHADLVVQGWHSTAGGCLLVDGQPWMSRQPDDLPGPDPDTRRNLFGWLSKTHPKRLIEAPQKDPLPDAYHPGFNNFCRRDDGFTAPTTKTALPPGATVSISRKICSSATDPDAFVFRLPTSLAAYTARLRAYCGHGPDKRRRWRVVDEVPLVPDTLIVRPGPPASPTATVLWRASWRHDAAPDQHWRAIEILEGG